MPDPGGRVSAGDGTPTRGVVGSVPPPPARHRPRLPPAPPPAPAAAAAAPAMGALRPAALALAALLGEPAAPGGSGGLGEARGDGHRGTGTAPGGMRGRTRESFRDVAGGGTGGEPGGTREKRDERGRTSERFWEGTGQEPEIAGGHRAGCGSSRRHRAGQQGARHRRAAAWEALGWHRVPGMGSQHPPGSVSPVPYLPQQADWRGDERGNPSPSNLRSAQSGENLSLPGKSHFCTLELPNSRFQHPPNPKRSHMGTPGTPM